MTAARSGSYYQDLKRQKVTLPKRQKPHGYMKLMKRRYNIVPEVS